MTHSTAVLLSDISAKHQKQAVSCVLKNNSSTYTELKNMTNKLLLCIHRMKLILREIYKIIYNTGLS